MRGGRSSRDQSDPRPCLQISRHVVRAGIAMRQHQQTCGRTAAAQLETQPRARGGWGAAVGGGFHKGPFLVHLLFSIILSKLFLVTDDAVDYENSTAIHIWKLQQAEGMFSAIVYYLRMGLMGRVPVALDQYRPRSGQCSHRPHLELFFPQSSVINI